MSTKAQARRTCLFRVWCVTSRFLSLLQRPLTDKMASAWEMKGRLEKATHGDISSGGHRRKVGAWISQKEGACREDRRGQRHFN